MRCTFNEGAPHSFFDRSYGEWESACADAWSRILAFTGKAKTTTSA